jgi:hypothetical protein
LKTIVQITHLALPLLLLAGCAATPSAPDTQTADAEAPVCKRSYRMGSSIPETICYANQSEADRLRQIDEVRNQTRPVVPPSNRSAGS